MSPDPLDYLRHILDEAEYLMDQTQDLAKEDFIGDDTLTYTEFGKSFTMLFN